MAVNINIPRPPRTYVDYRGGSSLTLSVQNTWYAGNRNTSLMSQLQLNAAQGTGSTPTLTGLRGDTNGLKLPFKCKFLEARFSAKTMPSSVSGITFEWYIYANEEPDGSSRGTALNAQVLYQGTFTTGAAIDLQLDKVLTPSSFPTLLIYTKIYVALRCTSHANISMQHPELIMTFEEVI